MRENQHLPDGVTICENCGEFYTAETTLSDFCEICDFYGEHEINEFQLSCIANETENDD